MEFIFDPQTWYIIATIAFVIATVYVLRLARIKGVDTDQIAKDVAQGIDYAKILLTLMKMNEETKGKLNTGLDAAKVVANFVTETNVAQTVEEEKELADKLVNDLLVKFKITPTPEEEVLMRETIDKAIRDKKNKNTIAIIKPVE